MKSTQWIYLVQSPIDRIRINGGLCEGAMKKIFFSGLLTRLELLYEVKYFAERKM